MVRQALSNWRVLCTDGYCHTDIRDGQALNKYEKAFKLIQYEQGEGEDADKVKDLKCVLHVNKAACFDKDGNLDSVLAECNKALDLRATNIKALFRRGKAYVALNK
jgi:hypothetical protein